MNSRQSRRSRSRVRPGDVALAAWTVLVYAFLFIPIFFIVVYSFNRGRALVAWKGFGTNWYAGLLGDHAIVSAIENSLKAGVGAALIATVLGSLAGYALARRPGKWTIAFLALVFLILVTPEIVTAISLLIWFVRVRGPFAPNVIVSYGLMRLWVGHSLFSLAVVTLIVRARLVGIDEGMEEAAADLYAPPFRRFMQVTLPLMWPAVLAGLLLSFSLSLDDTIISAFVSVAGSTPWPVFVLSATHSTLRPDVAAASTLMLVMTLSALAVTAVVLLRSGQSGVDVVETVVTTDTRTETRTNSTIGS
jgi:putrescine transport system permease protein